jgi:hypothetical protein
MKRKKENGAWGAPDGTLTTVAVIAAAGLTLFPLVRGTFLPFVDLPQHVALAQILAHMGDPTISGTFAADLFPQVNVLALLLMAPAMSVAGEEAAVLLVLALYVSGLAYSVNRLSVVLGMSRGNAVFALLFALNFNLMYGFMSFCLGIPVAVLIAARLAGAGGKTRPPAVVADAALWVLLALAHALLFVLMLAAALIWLAVAVIPFCARLKRLACAIPALLLALGWYVSGGGGLGPKPILEWHGLAEKLEGLGWSTIAGGVEGALEYAVLCGVCLFVLLMLALELKRSGRRSGGARSWAVLWIRLAAALALVLYFCLPYAIVSEQLETRGVFLLYNRFAVVAAILFIASLAWPASRGARSITIAAALVLHIMMLWNWIGLMDRVSAEAGGMGGAIEAMRPGAIVKSLIYTPYSEAVGFPIYLHAGSYYQARKMGEADQSFALLPSTPVHYRDAARPYLSHRDEHLAPHMFDWKDARLYDYILIYDRGGEWSQLYSGAPYSRVYQENGWSVLDVKNRRR